MPPGEQTDGIRRSKDGRPYIVDPETGKERLYTRASTFCRTLSDGAALEAWKLRMAYLGLSKEPVLLGDTEREVVDMQIATAMDLAGANEAANWGTALHSLTDLADGGVSMADMLVPADLADGLDRYLQVTSGLVPIEIERFVVNDLVRAAGTFDRIFRLPDGRLVMADLKTGTLRMLEHAIQLAVYAKAWHYDVATGARTEPVDVNPFLGLIVHVPRDRTMGDPELVWVDLAAAWEMVELAYLVRASRSRTFKVPGPIVGPGE